MNQASKPRGPGHWVICPLCDGTGRNGPLRAVCNLCWVTGVIPWWRYEHLLNDHERRHRTSRAQEPDGPPPEALDLAA
ncbi:hypothetical protein ABH920_006376 [Catenulispora sp. EB89]|uniref:hypothetical protein n=1 Tax=Catenulispora sp. EB89 TaxID=3156257 RepID=UPI00351313D4